MRKKYERNETVIKIDDAEKRKKILELLVDRIYIYDEEVVVTFFFCDDPRRLNFFLTSGSTRRKSSPLNRRYTNTYPGIAFSVTEKQMICRELGWQQDEH